MRATVSCVLVVLLATLALAVPATAGAATSTVRLKDSFFSPSRVTLARGGAVRFVWAGRLAHNLLGPGIPRRLASPATRHRPFTRVFSRRGRFHFLCSVHPGMETTVRVR